MANVLGEDAPLPVEDTDSPPVALEDIAEEEEVQDVEALIHTGPAIQDTEPPPLLDTEESEECMATPGVPLEARLRVIEQQNRAIVAQNSALRSELTETREMIRALTSLVQGLQQAPSGPPSTLVRPASTTVAMSAPSSSIATSDSQYKAATIARQSSSEGVASMTRTINTKDITNAGTDVPATRVSLSLATAVRVMRRVARVASNKTFAVPNMLLPMLTRRFSVSVLTYDTRKDEDSVSRRVSRWSQTILSKPARVEPEIVTKTDVITARLEDTPTHPLTIRHDSSGRIAWDALVMLIIMTDAVMTPLSLSFGYNPRALTTFNALETVAFTIDFVVQAFSSYTTKRGVVIYGPAKTIPRYLLSIWALADFLSWFPLEYIISKGRFLGVAKVVRLVKISQLMRRFHSSRKAGVFRLVRLISIVLLVSHCLACYWNWVAVEWRQNEEGYLDKSILDQYVHSWSIVIGSLNASPPVMHTPIEEISVAVFMLIGNVLQASVFGSVAVLIQSFDEGEVAYNKKLINTYERCKLLDIPEPLADRINSFYEHLYRETRSVDPDADAFINELSPALICEVKFQLYRGMVKQIPFFSSAEINPVIIEMLILRLHTVIYMQDDMLIRKGEFGDWMGFVGSKGSVGVLDPSSDVHKIVRILRKGDYFGEMSLLHRTKRTTTAVALSWVQIHVLSRQDLDEVKEQYSEDAESLEQEIRKYIRSRLSNKGSTAPK